MSRCRALLRSSRVAAASVRRATLSVLAGVARSDAQLAATADVHI
jgi:hypothetical protein